jgi:hypothetical protein
MLSGPGRAALLRDGALPLAGLACCPVGWQICKHRTAAAAAAAARGTQGLVTTTDLKTVTTRTTAAAVLLV